MKKIAHMMLAPLALCSLLALAACGGGNQPAETPPPGGTEMAPPAGGTDTGTPPAAPGEATPPTSPDQGAAPGGTPPAPGGTSPGGTP